MKWIEISVQCDGEAAEAVSELFNRFNKLPGETQGGAVVQVTGYDSVGQLSQPIVTVRTYLSAGKAGSQRLLQIEQGLWFLSRLYPIPEPSIRELAEEDWAHAWRAHYQPLRVGERLIIVPAWMVDEVHLSPQLLPVVLDPGMAFGTGLHPSTRLCLAAMERYLHPGDTMLDVGCGSGILSIAAVRLGAATVLATDIDPRAVQATQENCQRNGLVVGGPEPHVMVQEGSLPAPAERSPGYDVVVANILADVIVELLQAGLPELLTGHGRLVLGGMIAGQAEEKVSIALGQAGLGIIERTVEGDWVSLVAAPS